MFHKARFGILLAALLLIALLSSCAEGPENPLFSNETAGKLTFSIKNIDNSLQNKFHQSEPVAITSAQIIIKKIDLENEENGLIDFKFAKPFVQDLFQVNNLQKIETFQVPFGSYDKLQININELNLEDGDIFTTNPKLQNISIRIAGRSGANLNIPFEFLTDISLFIDLDFSPPIVLNEAIVERNIMLDLDYSSWFSTQAGEFIDPALSQNKERIEQNIKNSFMAFRDDNSDGEKDMDEFEIEGKIDSVGFDTSVGSDFIIVNGNQVFITNDTYITAPEISDRAETAATDLQVGMQVMVHTRKLIKSDILLAIKVMVNDNQNNNGDKGNVDFKIDGEIQVLDDSSMTVESKQILVTATTKFVAVNDPARTDASFSELKVGMSVEIEGYERENSALVARSVIFLEQKNEDEKQFKIDARIQALDYRSLTVEDKQILVSDETDYIKLIGQQAVEASFAELEIDLPVKVYGYERVDGVLIARTVLLISQYGDSFTLESEIQALDDSSVVVGGKQIIITNETEFMAIDDQEIIEISFSELEVGITAKIEGYERSDGVMVARKVTMDWNVELEGNFKYNSEIQELGNGYLVVRSFQILLTNETIFTKMEGNRQVESSFAELKVGQTVRVSGYKLDNGSKVARKVLIRAG